MFEQLVVIPEYIKTKDGYEYPDEYVYKFYEYEGNIIFFDKSSYYTFPKELVTNLIDAIKQHVINNIDNNINNNSDIIDNLDDIIDKKIGEVYNNFMPVIEKVITEKVTDIESVRNIKEKTNDDKTKPNASLSLGTLFALRESFSAEELVKMREAGLV